MQLRRLGNSGLKVSVIGLGCNNFGMRIDQAQTRMVVDAALDAGINFFDTADIYGGSKSEVFLGEALKGRRDKAVLATKFANPMGEGAYQRGGARRYIVKAVEDSLKRLHTDHIDLYQMHVPDPDTPIDETLRALDDLVRAGKVLYIGNSNFTGWQIADADWTSRTQGLERFVSAQNNFSLRRARGPSRLRALRAWPPALLPPRQRLPDRQVPPGRAAPAGHAACRLGQAWRRSPQRSQLRPPGGA